MADTETATARVRHAADLVLTDIDRTGAPARTFDVTDVGTDSGWADDGIVAGVLLDYGGHSFVVDGDRPLAELTCEIADRVQEDVIDDAGRAWPRSDGSQAPATATLDAGTAVWRTEAGTQTEIGQLAAG